MRWKARNLRELAGIVCGDVDHFRYRSSRYITEFFQDCDLNYAHDGSTRWAWVANRLEEVLTLPHPSASVPPDAFIRIIRATLDKDDRKTATQTGAKHLPR